MHEYPVTEQIVKIASQAARDHDAKRVTLIRLVVGEQSGFVGDSIQMYFDILAEGTLCQGAALEMEYIKAQWYCPHCALNYERSLMSFACPQCGRDGLPSDMGKEFYVRDIEIETD